MLRSAFLLLLAAALAGGPAEARKRRLPRPTPAPAAAPVLVQATDWDSDGARLLISPTSPRTDSRFRPPALDDSFADGPAQGVQVKLRVNRVKMKVPVTLR